MLHGLLALLHIIDGAYHVEELFAGHVVFALQDLFDAAHRLFEGDIFALDAREGLRHVHGLRQEALQLACSRYGDFVLLGEFLDAVRRTASGDAVFTPGLAALVLGEFRRLSEAPAGRPGEGVPRLSERETEILRMVATGMSYKQIATRLVLSVKTVETYKARSMEKLGLKDRIELVRYARQQGWLTPT